MTSHRLRMPAVLLGAAVLSSAIMPAAATAAPAEPATTAQPAHHRWDCPRPPHLAVQHTAHRYAALLRSLHGAELEQTFLTGMIGHHQMAVMMARMEVSKGKRPAAKALARRIIAAQEKEIARMQRMLNRWYDLTPQQALRQSPARDLLRKMDRQMRTEMMVPMMMASAGRATDRTFLRLMPVHHSMAIREARAAHPETRHTGLRKMEKEIIRSQRHERRVMLTWLRTWYC